jgi:hypothetical protein
MQIKFKNSTNNQGKVYGMLGLWRMGLEGLVE